MPSSPLVSVVIVNFNSADLLRACLTSLTKQENISLETIIVDNASTDDSLEVLVDFPPSILIRNQCNLGFAVAQNQGLRRATGRYLMPLNFDIRLMPNCIVEMVYGINQDQRIGSVSAKLLEMDRVGNPTGRIDNAGLLLPPSRYPTKRGNGEIDRGQYDDTCLVFGAIGAAVLYRRELLEDVAYRNQFFDEEYFMWYEDVDLEWRARLRGWECLYVPSAVAFHIGDPHGHGRSRLGAEISMRNRWRMILSNECPKCLVANARWLLGEDFRLVRHVIKHRFVGAYLRALGKFLVTLPSTMVKRRWVRNRAVRKCLPEYPQPI